VIADAVTDYRDKVTVGLLVDLLDVFEEHGIGWADDDPRRRADAVIAMDRFADAIAGPLREIGQ